MCESVYVCVLVLVCARVCVWLRVCEGKHGMSVWEIARVMTECADGNGGDDVE